MKTLKGCCLSLLLISLLGSSSMICVSANKRVNSESNLVNKVVNVDFSKYSKGLTYDLSEDKTYYIVSNNNYGLSDSNLIIPEEYEGLPVKEIASEGFAYRSWIQSVAIPKTIERIGAGAFNGTGLKEVYYNAANCEDFKGRNWVFYPDETTQNIALTIGKDVKRIPANFLFPLYTNPTITPIVNSITFEEGSVLEEIGEKAFYQINKIDSVNFPSNLKKIGDYAFYGSSLKNLTLPEGLEFIGKYSFANNTKLNSLNFPTTLKSVGVGCFKNCSSINEIEINNLLEIPNETFKYCSSLTKVVLNNVEKVGNSAFENCTSLNNLELGSSLKIIGESAFKNCNLINSLTLPNTLVKINNQAFYGLYNLTDLVINSVNLDDFETGNKIFYGLGKDKNGTKVTFTDEVKVIPAYMFSSYSLEEYLPNVNVIVIHGDSLEKINEWSFGYINAEVTYVGKISKWKQVDILEGNVTLSNVNCVKEVL